MAGEGRRVEVLGLPELRRALRKFAPEANRNLRLRLKAIAGVVAVGAKARASWSRRIPGAITTGVLARGPYVRVKASRAPAGPLYEARKSWRHPLFGDREHWYAQQGRPFVDPEVKARAAFIEQEAIKAIEAAKAEVDLR